MDNKVKVAYKGKEVLATIVEVNQASETWNTYLMDDQSVIKLKSVVTKVVKIDGEYDAEGNPVYLVKSANVMNVDTPEALKRK